MCRVPFHELNFNRFLELLEHETGNGNIFMVVLDSVGKDQLKEIKAILKNPVGNTLNSVNVNTPHDFKNKSNGEPELLHFNCNSNWGPHSELISHLI